MRFLLLLLLGLALFVGAIAVGCNDDGAADQERPERAQEQSESDALQQETEDPPSVPTDQSQQQEAEQPQSAVQVRNAQDEQGDEQSTAEIEQEQQQQSAVDPPAEVAEAEQDQVTQPQQEQAAETSVVLGGERPATLLLPQGADLSQPRPLIVLLHGYSSFARQADQYFQFSQWVDDGGFGLLLPDGTIDQIRNRFWNATPECCDIFGAEPDDVEHIKSLIEEAQTHAAFDRVFAAGHSNGGFMAYRLACEEAPGLTAIVSLAGGAFAEPEECRVPAPLSVLQIHGTDDRIVLYEGGQLPDHPDPDRRSVPGAKDSVLRWAERAGCDIERANFFPPIDTDAAVEGAETSIVRFSEGCASGTVMELWKIEGGGHIPLVWETEFTPAILKWLAERYDLESASAESAEPSVETYAIGGERSADLMLPTDRGDEPLPLVLSLHGYQGEAEAHDWYFGLSARILGWEFALITPQGTTDSRGYAFWNATDGCCNFHGSEVDDFAWLSRLVAEAREIVDVSGVYVVGYSNGGFMAYRLACDGLDGLVAIASLAGSSFGDPERCADAPPVSVLQIHGSDDLDIPYAGTLEYEGGYPGVVELINRWAARAGCDVASAVVLPSVDLEASVQGAETMVRQIRNGCADGITIELWTIEGADHFPSFQDDWPDRLLRWLFSESRAN
ncbi:MAG: hypothetical protein OXI41_05455 [Chloroflexota bacterium]|nr:hypothetical protein [Chloroflexota bacterium]MDE2894842.1 hypothetical protein [Chloroflexota bacterium]